MDAVEMKDTAKKRLMHDLKAVVNGAEDLLKVTSSNVGAEYASAKKQLERRLAEARDQLNDVEDAALKKARHAARATDTFVHDHPWQAIGVGAAVGIAIGVLISRK